MPARKIPDKGKKVKDLAEGVEAQLKTAEEHKTAAGEVSRLGKSGKAKFLRPGAILLLFFICLHLRKPEAFRKYKQVNIWIQLGLTSHNHNAWIL